MTDLRTFYAGYRLRLIKLEQEWLEIRARHWIKGEHGYFAGSYSTGGGAGAKKAVDKAGESGIIKLRINLFDKSDKLYTESFSIEEEPGYEDVMLHGSPNSVEVTIKGKKKNLGPAEFAEYLKMNGYKGGDLRLASCSTGNGDNSFAQRLSAILGNKVKAPDDDVYFIPEDGVLFVGSKYSNTGKWRIFDKGVEIND
ncbi:MAG: hypothetical protein IJ071_05130 [Ruminococcus sp.]|nr:hypothetical protein [Ruminococcus sp.]